MCKEGLGLDRAANFAGSYLVTVTRVRRGRGIRGLGRLEILATYTRMRDRICFF